MRVKQGSRDEAAVKSEDPSNVKDNDPFRDHYDLFLTPDNHAKQVWDRIRRGEFYCVGENERPVSGPYHSSRGLIACLNHR